MKINNYIKQILFVLPIIYLIILILAAYITDLSFWWNLLFSLIIIPAAVLSFVATDFVFLALISLFSRISLKKMCKVFYAGIMGTGYMHHVLFWQGREKLLQEVDKVLETSNVT